jgi:hypothetical protein
MNRYGLEAGTFDFFEVTSGYSNGDYKKRARKYIKRYSLWSGWDSILVPSKYKLYGSSTLLGHEVECFQKSEHITYISLTEYGNSGWQFERTVATSMSEAWNMPTCLLMLRNKNRLKVLRIGSLGNCLYLRRTKWQEAGENYTVRTS